MLDDNNVDISEDIIQERGGEFTIIGIDPGKNGGMVALDGNGTIQHYAIPKIDKDGEIDWSEFSLSLKLFQAWKVFPGYDTTIFIEDVHSIFGVSAKANFQFGKNCGLIEGMVIATKLPYYKVAPKIWQKFIFEEIGVDPVYKSIKKRGRSTLETKQMSLKAFEKLFPEVDFRVTAAGNKSKNQHNGLVDAILIAEYGRRKFFK